MMMHKSLIPLVFGIVAMAAGCADYGRVAVDSEDPFNDTTTDSKDYVTVAQAMARDIVQVQQISQAEKPPTVAFARVENRSSIPLDTTMFLEEIRTLLSKNVGGKIIFLDRAKSEEVLRERDLKRSGELTSSSKKAVLGADYFLTGSISTIDKTDGKERTTMMRYEFRLTDAESTQIVWVNDYKVKKYGKKGLYER
ncbi:MAG TPA: hypothetical protein VM223_01345 [Planctomycetota bacterium]|nr:hypothetical protein [Planctomycetota bacterium]